MADGQSKKRKIPVCHFRGKCIGCGACEMVAPDNWKIDEDGKATLKDSKPVQNFYRGDIDAQDLDANKLAEELCPVNIIRVDD